jgi:hypothetical protein
MNTLKQIDQELQEKLKGKNILDIIKEYTTVDNYFENLLKNE